MQPTHRMCLNCFGLYAYDGQNEQSCSNCENAAMADVYDWSIISGTDGTGEEL